MERDSHMDVRISRVLRVPDPIRVERCARMPELGPRILFLSGGTALRDVCRVLKAHTHNSIHLVTPFDSGGSSANLRDAFGMLAVGDLRNRIMALADESTKGNPGVFQLFSTRLRMDASEKQLREELDDMVAGDHPALELVGDSLMSIVRTHLRAFISRMPPTFTLRGACIGNLLLAGEYLTNDRDIDAVMLVFSKLVEARGTVLPVVDCNLSLLAQTRSGEFIAGQHVITGRARHDAIETLSLVDPVTGERVPRPGIRRRVRSLLLGADLICYPMGSFFTSVVANLLPDGVGRAIADATCPKVYIPNVGQDPEQAGLSVADCVAALVRFVREDAGQEVPVEQILDFVVVDSRADAYASKVDVDAIQSLGVRIIDRAILTETTPPRHDPRRITEILLSLA